MVACRHFLKDSLPAIAMAGGSRTSQAQDQSLAAIGLLAAINNADINNALGPLIFHFLRIFAAVGRVNAEGAFTSFSFDTWESLVSDEDMRAYTAILAEASPHKTDFVAHARWVHMVVIASLKGALARSPGQPSELILATCEMFIFMAEEIMDFDDDDEEDEEEDDEEEEEEEEDEHMADVEEDLIDAGPQDFVTGGVIGNNNTARAGDDDETEDDTWTMYIVQ